MTGLIMSPAKQRAMVDAAKKLTPYRHQLSYNQSYFGEPPGLLKSAIADLERMLPAEKTPANTPAQ